MADHPKPVPGVDTPFEDDIITQCEGGCGKWMVAQHPSHVRGGCATNPATGELSEWQPTPEWVEAEAAWLAQSHRRCLDCGPGAPLTDEQQAERERVGALREFA